MTLPKIFPQVASDYELYMEALAYQIEAARLGVVDPNKPITLCPGMPRCHVHPADPRKANCPWCTSFYWNDPRTSREIANDVMRVQ